jgi:c(7)-type cytochrome triheme protein
MVVMVMGMGIRAVGFVFTCVYLMAGCQQTAVIEQGGEPRDELTPEQLALKPAVSVLRPKPEVVPEGYTLTGKKLSIVEIKPIESLNEDGIHDDGNNAFVVLQDPNIAMKDFPKDRRKQINWVKTLDSGLIQPRADLHGENEMLVMDMDILMKNTKDMPYVRFPHLQHTKWLDCSNCHPKIFIPKENANPISMNKVLRGEYCGVCHDKVAFALFTCERCHSVPHAGSGKWW